MEDGGGLVASRREGGVRAWRTLSRPEFGLADVISNQISSSGLVQESCLNSLRSASTLLMFSDYGGAHKGARYEVLSFLVSTVESLGRFDVERRGVREGSLGFERRMSYKALNDRVRAHALSAYLNAADCLEGLLMSFAIDKGVLDRLSEDYTPYAAFGELSSWAGCSFHKLTRVANLAAILIEGIRQDGQNLVWITDEDEIAPNESKHVEATRLLGHVLSHYCSGPMGHFRFGTTASDDGSLLIEDLTSAPDIAAGCIGEVLSLLAPHPGSGLVERLFVPSAGGGMSAKGSEILAWLSNSSTSLLKLRARSESSQCGSGVSCCGCRV